MQDFQTVQIHHQYATIPPQFPVNSSLFLSQPSCTPPASWWASSSTAACPYSSSSSSRPCTRSLKASPVEWSRSWGTWSPACCSSSSPSTAQVRQETAGRRRRCNYVQASPQALLSELFCKNNFRCSDL